jgi:hypothetical protein
MPHADVAEGINDTLVRDDAVGERKFVGASRSVLDTDVSSL